MKTTRRHETGFSEHWTGEFFGLTFDLDTSAVGLPLGVLQLTSDQIGFLTIRRDRAEIGSPAIVGAAVGEYAGILGASSGDGDQRSMAGGAGWATGIHLVVLQTPGTCFVPGSYQTLTSQQGNFPVFEGTSLYSFRIDHNISNNNRLSLNIHASPSTVTGIEVSGQDQPFGQNAYSRTSQQTYRDVSGTAQDTWTIGNNKVNEFRFQFARRGLEYFYNTAIPGGSDPAVNIPGIAYFGREPYSYIRRVEKRYQFMENFAWTIGRHDTKFGGDFNYLPLTATFTVNYGGVFDFGSVTAAQALPTPLYDLLSSISGAPQLPGLSSVQAYGFGAPQDFIQGLGSPSDNFKNIPIGVFWQDSWHARHNLTLNYGVRYDVEIAPKFTPPQGLALPAYNLLGLQKGIKTDKNNFQPRIGMAWDPHGDGKTVVRASYGIFYDHPLLGLYFLGDASDGSSSGQLAFAPGAPCGGAGNPGNLNAVSIFQGLIPAANGSPASPCSPATTTAALGLLNYSPNQQRFSCASGDPTCGVASPANSIFLNQNYLNPSTFLPLAFQPFGYPQGKNFVYAYSQQVNLTVERDLGSGYAFSLAYNFNGGRHLNRPINANTVRGDLLVNNYLAAAAAGQVSSSPFTVGTGSTPCGAGPAGPWVSAPLMNFFRPGGLNPSFAAFYNAVGAGSCVGLAQSIETSLASQGFNTNCDPTTYAGCVPFGDMDANYSNGTSDYHGLTANLRKRFGNHYEFQASYTWSHAIDDSTDLQSTLTPQDSYNPRADRSTSLFDERHRFVFNGVYQSGKLGGSGFASKFFSNWTFAPLIEFGSGRPFNIITSGDDNFQLSSLTGRPNVVPVGTSTNGCGYPAVASKFAPTGLFQEPCFLPVSEGGNFTGTLASLDGNLGRNSGVTPWTVFNDIRLARRVNFNERLSMDLITDMFNIANVYNVAAVSPLFTNAGQATAAYDPRQFQFALKLNW